MTYSSLYIIRVELSTPLTSYIALPNLSVMYLSSIKCFSIFYVIKPRGGGGSLVVVTPSTLCVLLVWLTYALKTTSNILISSSSLSSNYIPLRYSLIVSSHVLLLIFKELVHNCHLPQKLYTYQTNDRHQLLLSYHFNSLLKSYIIQRAFLQLFVYSTSSQSHRSLMLKQYGKHSFTYN